MSKLENALKLLMLLKTKGKLKRSEIVDELGIKERQIWNLKEAWNSAGVEILSESGKNGGYVLKERAWIPKMKILDEEYKALASAKEFLTKESGFPYCSEYESALLKINSYKSTVSTLHHETLKTNLDNCFYGKDSRYYKKLEGCIQDNRKVELYYKSLNDNNPKKRTVRPYGLVQYKHFNYLVGYCELRKEIRDFKLIRIEHIGWCNEKFKMDESFDLEVYKKESFGIYKSAPMNLKIKVKHPFSRIVKEQNIAFNQNITDLANGDIILDLVIAGEEEILSWILSMGSSAEVLEPEAFAQKVKGEIKKMLKNYNVCGQNNATKHFKINSERR